MQVGCGVDSESYAMAFSNVDQQINVGILINDQLPILEYMDNYNTKTK
jgi:hypothetical protein